METGCRLGVTAQQKLYSADVCCVAFSAAYGDFFGCLHILEYSCTSIRMQSITRTPIDVHAHLSFQKLYLGTRRALLVSSQQLVYSIARFFVHSDLVIFSLGEVYLLYSITLPRKFIACERLKSTTSRIISSSSKTE